MLQPTLYTTAYTLQPTAAKKANMGCEMFDPGAKDKQGVKDEDEASSSLIIIWFTIYYRYSYRTVPTTYR